MVAIRQSYRSDYDHLCDIAHPNALEAVVYFQQLGEHTDVAIYQDKGPSPDEDLTWVLVGAHVLSHFDKAINRIEARLPQLSAKGAENSPYRPGGA
jgi:hypothetical protein